MADPGLKMKPSPFVKGTDPTHTSYEFSLPYHEKGSDNADEDEDEDEDEDGRHNDHGSHLSPRSHSPRRISSPITMSHASDPAAEEAAIASRARGLAGKYIDEFGNVLGWDGTVLGAVHGDLPSMVGRPVSESGYVVDSTGEIVGYVSENFTDSRTASPHPPHPPLPPRELDRSLKVDEHGNILDANGEIVGKMKDNARGGGASSGFGGGLGEGSGAARQQGASAATPSPSEVYLDVKSTHDGIQLVIKIPTVFNPRGDSER